MQTNFFFSTSQQSTPAEQVFYFVVMPFLMSTTLFIYTEHAESFTKTFDNKQHNECLFDCEGTID